MLGASGVAHVMTDMRYLSGGGACETDDMTMHVCEGRRAEVEKTTKRWTQTHASV